MVLEWAGWGSSSPTRIMFFLTSPVLSFRWLEILERTWFYRPCIFKSASIRGHNHIRSRHVLNDYFPGEHFRFIDTLRRHLLQRKTLLMVSSKPFPVVMGSLIPTRDPALILTVCSALSFQASISSCSWEQWIFPPELGLISNYRIGQ